MATRFRRNLSPVQYQRNRNLVRLRKLHDGRVRELNRRLRGTFLPAGAILRPDFAAELEDDPSILRDHFGPGPDTHLLEIDPAKAQTHNEVVDAPAN